MFQAWRLKLREAEECVRQGRLDDASRLLRHADLQEFYPARRLLAKVAHQMAERGQMHMARGETSAGWRDLESAAAIGADDAVLASLRTRLLDGALREVEAYVAADDPAAAIARLDELAHHKLHNADCRKWREVATKVASAQRLARRGDFAQAQRDLDAAITIVGDVRGLDLRRKEYATKTAECRRRLQEMHRALAAEDWNAVLGAADAVLELAPESTPARDARRRAWAAVGTRLSDTNSHRAAPAARRALSHGGVALANNHSLDFDLTMEQHEPRFLLWVDTVGGFLVCQGDQVTLGQPSPECHVDVPILGDLSSRHAIIRRSGEGYVIEPSRPTRLGGKLLDGTACLVDGSLIELGSGVRLRFRRPHPLSATARLEFASHHRTQPAADAVILMAESCVLSPQGSSHVECRRWEREVVLYRQNHELLCRTAGRFDIDGTEFDERGPITRSSRISGDDFSLSLEEV